LALQEKVEHKNKRIFMTDLRKEILEARTELIEERLLNENSEFNVELVDLKKLREALIEETNEVVSKVVQTDDLDGIEMLKLNLFQPREF